MAAARASFTSIRTTCLAVRSMRWSPSPCTRPFPAITSKAPLPSSRRASLRSARPSRMRYHEAPAKFPMNTGYIEGWGLYSEYLGIEMNLYTSPYTRFGRLCYDILRATRLVVDTGMHAMGWDRGRAIQLLARNASMGMHEATMEIDRYIAWPGQACAYKIGDIRIRELRKHAESALATANNGASAFDIREFHDEILRCGAIPLDVLADVVERYIARKLRR
eukprot:Opistho-1_new@91332